MAKFAEDKQLRHTVDEIRRKLTSNPSTEELKGMQLHLDLLEKWARIANVTDADHQHNHMNDHDNTAFVEPFVVLASPEKAER